MTNETRSALQEDFRTRALLAGTGTVALSALAISLLRSRAPHLGSGLLSPRALPVLILGIVAALLAGWWLRLRQYRRARAAAVAQIAALLTGWMLAQYPYIVYPEIALASAAAPPATRIANERGSREREPAERTWVRGPVTVKANEDFPMRVSILFSALLLPLSAAAQDRVQQQYDSAYLAWDAGRYPDALNQLKRLLNNPGAERFFEPVALLTGELFTSIEVAPSDRHVVALTGGRAPKWSPDGRHFAFETTAGHERRTHVYRIENNRAVPVVVLNGFNLAFAGDGVRVAYLRVTEDAELGTAQAGLVRLGGQDRQRAMRLIAGLEAEKAAVIESNLMTGQETVVPTPGISRSAVHYGSNNELYVTGAGTGGTEMQIYRVSAAGAPVPVTAGGSTLRVVQPLAGNQLLVSEGNNAFGIVSAGNPAVRTFNATSFSVSADGRWIVFLTRADNQNSVQIMGVQGAGQPTEVKRSALQIANPVISPDGKKVAFQMMPREDWELYVVDASGQSETRITQEIQHDHTPRFLTADKLLGVIGENRHRRSYVYDLNTRERTRLFHNNQIRTVSMEYAWTASPDGSKVLIVADRDGDTISPERGVYVMDLTSKIGKPEVMTRLDQMLAGENDLRERGRAMFASIAPRVTQVLQDASVGRVYGYEKAMFDFGSKFITQPGNQKAAEYIFNTLKAFGYEPEYQWFEARGVRTANIIATLRGTVDPELLYVVSSHYDSVERGPGADDDTSGSAALLEAARLLAGKPRAATIKFAWFTGEEAGLLGSREYVRQAVARGDMIIGALNNDMIGFANDHRLDNTIRYSNAGLRDLQHAAAFLFTDLVTYDSKYYQSTDAHAYYEAYGDIVGGIGSYPILGNPHYHQSHDVLETINHQLVTEVAKTTTATLMLMASSPARLKEITATMSGGGAQANWSKAPESSVTGYIVRYWPGNSAQPRELRVAATHATLPGVRAGDRIWVKAVNAQGLQGWDWARTVAK